ncbi:VOC family protein [Allosaccharopolyspora coralli]|uniref:VOC family protein n=1 Tax=Allosaccharopolyspora coralli TaxID=2665642 RepID=A0A5Q3QD38_9PSEU|nr:VOC family protein [Allosaccharopolyspora coralli]QGK71820.1 VOC family protein [Allosaccharopolyspora coralli]
MSKVGVRYIVDHVGDAVAFYTERLGFVVEFDATPGFAALERGDLRLLLNAVGGSGGASQAMADGEAPVPGGWNRIQLVVDDLEGAVARLRAQGTRFRSEVIVGRGGSQILLEDPAGNLVELFEPAG